MVQMGSAVQMVQKGMIVQVVRLPPGARVIEGTSCRWCGAGGTRSKLCNQQSCADGKMGRLCRWCSWEWCADGAIRNNVQTVKDSADGAVGNNVQIVLGQADGAVRNVQAV